MKLDIRSLEGSIRYVGVIWFVFHVLQLLLIRFTPKKYHVALVNLG